MKRSFLKRPISSYVTPAVFLLFGLCLLCVVLAGAGAYGRLVSHGERDYTNRTCTQYISSRVRQSGIGKNISVESFGGSHALVFQEPLDGKDLTTRIYCWDGWLMELFSYDDGEFSPEDGEKLIPATSVEFSLQEGLLEALVVDEFGYSSLLLFSLNDGEGASR